MADDKKDEIVTIPQPPGLMTQVLHVGKIIALVLVTLAGGILAVAAQSPALIPAWLTGLATSICGLGAALGIASNGIKAPSDSGAGPLKSPDELK
jgi:hypothetical protein